MSSQLSETEQLIISKSKQLFYEEGNIKATCQEIADFSGVQRTLVNYYFRSKDNLVRIAHAEIIAEMHEGLHGIYTGITIPFEEKIERLIDFTFTFKRKYPYFEVFNIIRSNNLIDENLFLKPQTTNEMWEFLKQIQEQMDRGVIRRSNPINFVLNIFSLVSYPLVMKGIFKDVFDLSEDEFEQILQERKELIKNLIFNK